MEKSEESDRIGSDRIGSEELEELEESNQKNRDTRTVDYMAVATIKFTNYLRILSAHWG